MNNVSNLAKRSGSNNYYYRESVPLDVRSILARNGLPCKNEIWKSLRTPSVQDAKMALVSARAEQHKRWADIRAHDLKIFETPTEHDLKSAAVTYGYDLAFENQSKVFRQNVDADNVDAALDAKRESLKQRALDPTEREDIARLAILIAKKEKWKLEDGQLDQLRKYLHEAVLDSLNGIIAVFEGKPRPEPTSSVVKQVREGALSNAAPGESILELFDLYVKAKIAEGTKSRSALRDAKTIFTQLTEFVGKKRALGSISKSEIRNFRNLYAAIPARWNLRKEFKGLTFVQAAKKASGGDWPLRSPATVAKAISDISAVYIWAIDDGYAVDNPTERLKPKPHRGESRRPPYKPEQLKSFFESPLFTGCDPQPGKEHLKGKMQIRDWRYWVPIIALFTGARAGEIAQLRCGDVVYVEETWIFDIHKNPDRHAPKHLKNKNSVRPIPIHQAIIELGFLNYLTIVQSEPDDLLFPEIELDHRDQMGGRPSRFIRTYLKRIGLKEPGLGLHSFRHTWIDECRKRGIYDALSGSILGHAKVGTTTQYGSGTEGNLTQRKRAIDALDFEGFDLHRH